MLTNGGGIEEHERAERLSQQLGFPIHPSQYCQAHTVLKKFAHGYRDKPVLVLGGKRDVIRKVANGYGYKRACTTLDVLAWNPSVWPFHTLSEREEASTQKIDFSNTPISAIFVYHDPRNWALDIQVPCDVIQSAGIIGGPYIPLEKQREPVEVIFCNPDLLWRSDFDRPRLGQGAFKVAVQAVLKAMTGAEYPHTQFGKPTKETYEYATEMLKGRINEMYGESDVFPHVSALVSGLSLPIFTLDIAGANGAHWSSVLVKTGVYDPSQGHPSHPPSHCADDVEEAVKWALEQHLEGRLRSV
ncbi:hypothetical protein M413DRAFT_441735 [Hebeloma cylindrosporum]|uniref:Uncharacterized protein n=1 Tax=Hebeloma cylindrosporum TaxID=76867 RepID=A0A0C3CMT2_HEBCY|nr:hypothetical protein M413DRAFT_441735 [Hebeloma cylindrosporum h7]